MKGEEPVRAVRVATFPNGELGIVWEDGHESYLPARDLRCACACAQCVDEMSGRKLLQDEGVPDDIRIAGLQPVGNYAIAIRFSDGHDTGIYAFDRLRHL